MLILGISAYYHDSAACLLEDDNIIAASQEERFSRIRHDFNFPKMSIQFCLDEKKITLNDVDFVVFYEKPFLKFERIFETYLAFAPIGFTSFSKSLPVWVKDKLFQKSILINELNALQKIKTNWNNRILFSEHHLSHAASAFFPSPFHEAAILTMDGVGEWSTTSVAIGKNNEIEMLKEINFPHSLGLLYSAFTQYLGFKVNSGEYKVMGLAPYGEPKYLKKIKDNLISINNDGSFQLNMSYFAYCTELKMVNKKFEILFGGNSRLPESKITQKEMDIAASIQKLTEEIVLKIAINIKKETNLKNICLAGGVALNCVANGNLLKKEIFEQIWIQPASGDAGGAIGSALSAYYSISKKNRKVSKNIDSMRGSFLGPKFSNQEVQIILKDLKANYEKLSEVKIIKLIANLLNEGKAIGLFNGKMEFGPRSLGARSIIADPRKINMQKQLNLKVKFRESFRPFAPSILENDMKNWFKTSTKSPYMLFVSEILDKHRIDIKKKEKNNSGFKKLSIIRSSVPAITHVDYTSRIQTVSKTTNMRFYKILKEFKKITGCPMLVNTSFNVRGEPIVCTPKDAFNCFMGTDLDVLIIENFVLFKNKQSKSLKKDYRDKYHLD